MAADTSAAAETLDRALDRLPWCSWLLVLANTGLYVYCAVISRDVNVAPEVMAFAWKTPVSVEAGQWWRLVSCIFLHANLLHLALNMIGILNVGSLVERLIGPALYLVLFLASGICGALLSVKFGPYAGVGSSGAVLGLLGGLVVLTARWGRLVRELFGRWFAPQCFGLLMLNVLVGFKVPRVDNLAHLGGIACGLSLTWLADLRPLRTGPRPWRRGAELGAAGAALVLLVAVGGQVVRAAQPARAVEWRTIQPLGVRLEVPETWLTRPAGRAAVAFYAPGVPATLTVERLRLTRAIRPGEEEDLLRRLVGPLPLYSEPAPMQGTPGLWHLALRRVDIEEWFVRFDGDQMLRVTGTVRGDWLATYRPVFVRAAGTLRDLRPPRGQVPDAP